MSREDALSRFPEIPQPQSAGPFSPRVRRKRVSAWRVLVEVRPGTAQDNFCLLLRERRVNHDTPALATSACPACFRAGLVDEWGTEILTQGTHPEVSAVTDIRPRRLRRPH
jgi:hypothetical protein